MPVTQTEISRPVAARPADAQLPEPSIVVVHAVLEQGRYSWVWVVRVCPYCGKQHDHFGGPLDGDPYHYVGMSFVAHCDQTDRQPAVDAPSGALWYHLVAMQPDEQATETGQLRSIGRG